MAAPTRKKIFSLRGEGQQTREGVPRQQLLVQVEPGDPVQLQRQPENAYDPNAIAVVWQGADIGFLARDDAATLVSALDAGQMHEARVHALEGGVPNYPSYGVKVAIAWDGQKLPDPIPLDVNQERSRLSKIAAQGRERDASGAFTGKGGGCLGTIALLATAAIAIPLGLFPS